MVNLEIKNQIFELFKTRFAAANIEQPKNIFIKYVKGAKVRVDYDTEKGDELGFTDNMIMKNFLLSQIKAYLAKVEKEKIEITYAISTINLETDTILLDCFYDTKNQKQKTFNHTL